MQQNRVITIRQRNFRTAVLLTVVMMAMFAYSYVVIRSRGHLPEPTNLTPAQKIWRGL